MTDTVKNEDFWQKIKEVSGYLPDHIKQSFEAEGIINPFLMKKLFEQNSIIQVANELNKKIKKKTPGKTIKCYNIKKKKFFEEFINL